VSDRLRAIAHIAGFDPCTVADQVTFDAPHLYPVGVSHVLVNGVPVIGNGALPGQVLTGPSRPQAVRSDPSIHGCHAD
jgi:N-acyl-D-amino-acid deacylase